MFEIFPFLNNIINNENQQNQQNQSDNQKQQRKHRKKDNKDSSKKGSKRNRSSRNIESNNEDYNNWGYGNYNGNNAYNNQNNINNNYGYNHNSFNDGLFALSNLLNNNQQQINSNNNSRRNNNFNNGQMNRNNSFNNNIRNQNNNFNSIDNIFNAVAGSFTSIFNEVFTTVMENQDIITNIVDTVLNSDVVSNMMEAMEENLDLNFIEYEDRYLIEGKLTGVKKKDIDIDYENNYVKIKVKKDMTFTNGSNAMVHIFKDTPDLEKTYHVPNVDQNKIKAVYKDDILKLYLKKQGLERKEDTIIDVDYSLVD